MLEELQDRISKFEAMKAQAVMEKGALENQVSAKEAYICEIFARLNELYWVEEALKNENR